MDSKLDSKKVASSDGDASNEAKSNYTQVNCSTINSDESIHEHGPDCPSCGSSLHLSSEVQHLDTRYEEESCGGYSMDAILISCATCGHLIGKPIFKECSGCPVYWGTTESCVVEGGETNGSTF